MRDRELEIRGLLWKCRGILGKLVKQLFIRFYSFSQVLNTFHFWGNLIPFISPVATVKTGEIPA